MDGYRNGNKLERQLGRQNKKFTDWECAKVK